MNTKEKMRREFDEISMNIDSLNNEPQSDEQKELTNKRDAMRNMWESVKDDSGDAWESVKDGFEKGTEELKAAYHKAKAKIT